MVLFQPGADVDAGTAVDSNPDVWSQLFAPFANEDYDSDEEEDEDENPKEHAQLLSDTTKIWAPDSIVVHLTGPFKDCKRFADVPRALRAAPDAKTWAGVQLWLWWLPPSSFYVGVGDGGGGDEDGDGDDRVVCKPRVITIWIAMLSAYKSSEVLDVLPDLEPEL